MDNDLGGLLFNGQKRPNRVSGTDGVTAERRFRSEHATATSTGRVDGSGPLAVRQRAAARRHGARLPGLQRGPEHLQGVPAAERTSNPVRVDVRQHLQPDAVLRSEHELERGKLRAGRLQCNSAAVGSVGRALRFLVTGAETARAHRGIGNGMPSRAIPGPVFQYHSGCLVSIPQGPQSAERQPWFPRDLHARGCCCCWHASYWMRWPCAGLSLPAPRAALSQARD